MRNSSKKNDMIYFLVPNHVLFKNNTVYLLYLVCFKLSYLFEGSPQIR